MQTRIALSILRRLHDRRAYLQRVKEAITVDEDVRLAIVSSCPPQWRCQQEKQARSGWKR